MNLKCFKRTAAKKSEATSIRRDGNIPAVIYSKGQAGDTVYVDGSQFKSALRSIKQGCLPTTVFSLETEDGKVRRAIVKDIQYNVTNYDIIHLDLEELHDDCKINVKVPIECVGTVDCVGVKLGGVLRQVIRHVRVRCLPKDIPVQFQLDVRDLGLRQSKRLADIAMPATVRPLMDLKEVAVVIVKR